MERREEIDGICKSLDTETLKLMNPLIDQLIFLEERLEGLRKLPFIVVKDGEPQKQRATPAYRQYKDLSQTYINALKVVNAALGIKSDTVESPLRIYMEQRIQQNE